MLERVYGAGQDLARFCAAASDRLSYFGSNATVLFQPSAECR